MAVFATIWSIYVYVTEFTLIIGSEYTIPNLIVTAHPDNTLLNFLLSVFILSGLTLTCMFTIFNAKLSETLFSLNKGQTDC